VRHCQRIKKGVHLPKSLYRQVKEVRDAMNTITLEFKAAKVKIPTEGLTFEALEEMVFGIRQHNFDK